MKQGFRKQKESTPLDLSFLKDGYYDGNGNLRPEILDEKALELARHFVRTKVSSSQMRRFFMDVRELERKIHTDFQQKKIKPDSTNEEDLQNYLAMIKMLKSKLAYAKGRGNISAAFAKTMTDAIDQIKSPRDFKAFVLFFESIMGFYYGEGGGRIR